MVKKVYIPGRGDLVYITLDPVRGHEQAGRRPALVVSPVSYNSKSGLALMCPVTSVSKGYAFEVAIKGDISGVVLADQIRSIDWRARRASFVGNISNEAMLEIKEKLTRLIQ